MYDVFMVYVSDFVPASTYNKNSTQYPLFQQAGEFNTVWLTSIPGADPGGGSKGSMEPPFWYSFNITRWATDNIFF